MLPSRSSSACSACCSACLCACAEDGPSPPLELSLAQPLGFLAAAALLVDGRSSPANVWREAMICELGEGAEERGGDAEPEKDLHAQVWERVRRLTELRDSVCARLSVDEFERRSMLLSAGSRVFCEDVHRRYPRSARALAAHVRPDLAAEGALGALDDLLPAQRPALFSVA